MKTEKKRFCEVLRKCTSFSATIEPNINFYRRNASACGSESLLRHQLIATLKDEKSGHTELWDMESSISKIADYILARVKDGTIDKIITANRKK